MDEDFKEGAIAVTIMGVGTLLTILVGIGLIWGVVAASSVYSVWSSGKAGEAQLAQANYNRQIAVKEADAKKAAAVELAQAEVIRAKGVAKANKIIGQSLNNNKSYLTYLWIQSLESKYNKVIYVPVNGNLPILEAGRLSADKGAPGFMTRSQTKDLISNLRNKYFSQSSS